MFNIFNEDERGQVGIGTLIVFIAMVLVAAIAAGVLVNTAGFLQATAEDAGQESVNKVTNRVEVVNTHGVVDGTNNVIDQINMTVRLAAGSGAVDMNETSIKYLSKENVKTLSNNTANKGVGTGTQFGLSEITDDDGSFGVLNSPSDRYTVVINTDALENTDNGLDTGEQVTLEITSRTGGTTQVMLTMPQQLAGKNDGDPVEL
ncbi:flagellin [Halobellus sp. Atlit-38R]|uniref:archaellin/type IV pilin N-terminal domain-containing protein n=1 Tax=Halobellus sp. Atlit-38R TaxID=2282131 RepID=UPI000EF25A1C|nr:archaellin/type IV pilin N-terminal domain-containing protein [Halobellus sp. Atlit-38R]RLM94598.1 flagellin [Halobellus sp. Atlit-38R]